MEQTQVVIAGAGPVGMTLAHDLASRGVRCIVAERNPTTTAHPKMDITNARTMEMFGQAGLAPALRAVAVPEDHCFDVSWITRFTGHELHRFRYDSPAQARAKYRARNDGTQPAEPPMRVSQVEIEPVLRRAIEAHPLIEVRFGAAFEAFVEEAHGVTVTLRDQATGRARQVQCQYLVGCDGGGSLVRTQLGIELSGQPRIMQRFMTHFRCDARHLLQRWGRAWHYQSVFGTLIAQNDHDVWTLHTRVPAGVDVASVDPHALVAQFVGQPVDMEVLVANPWVPHLLVADAYGRGRVLLAGDAVHQYIPTGGYGMNTGVADAFDLAWKLAAVLHGFGGPALLGSYEAERRPVGLRNREGSQRHNGVRVEIAQLYEPAIHQHGPAGDAVRAAVATRIAALGNAENESVGLEMGFCYLNSPILPAGPQVDEGFDPLRCLPRTDPGCRLPHVFLEDGSSLYAHLGPWFTLLLFGGEVAPALVRAAAAWHVPLRVVNLGVGWRELYGAEAVLVRPDQHIAWRGDREVAGADAGEVVRRMLGWRPAAAEQGRRLATLPA